MSKHELPAWMESHAADFDQPLDSRAHRDLAEHGWIAGDFVTVRYWLGRLVGRNLFREGDEVVSEELHDYLATRGPKGACLGRIREAWRPLADLLRHHVELGTGLKPHGDSRTMAALEAAVADPELNDEQLAALANTTEKQVGRMGDVLYVRKLFQLHTARTRG